MNECADSARLRSHLDQPEAALGAHVDECPECTGLLRSVAADAGFARKSLLLLDPPPDSRLDVDVDSALRKILAADTGGNEYGASEAARPFRSAFQRRFAVAGVALAAMFTIAVTPFGRGAVAGVVDVFRTDRVEVIEIAPSDLATISEDELSAISRLGEVDTSNLNEPSQVDDLAQAEIISGIEAPSLLESPDRVLAMPPGYVELTLRSTPDNPVPDHLEGTTLTLSVPGALGAVFTDEAGDPQVFVARIGKFSLTSSDASLDDVRAYVIDHDALPSRVRRQLASIEDWRTTIPLPVPTDGPGWSEVELQGDPTLVFGDDTGLGSIVIRQAETGMTVVFGRLKVSEALAIAEKA